LPQSRLANFVCLSNSSNHERGRVARSLGIELWWRLLLININSHIRHDWRLWSLQWWTLTLWKRVCSPPSFRLYASRGLPGSFASALIMLQGLHCSSQYLGNGFKQRLGFWVVDTLNVCPAFLLSLEQHLGR